jgi:hypothetical protein
MSYLAPSTFPDMLLRVFFWSSSGEVEGLKVFIFFNELLSL